MYFITRRIDQTNTYTHFPTSAMLRGNFRRMVRERWDIVIYVIATIELEPGRRDEFLEIFRANVPNVQAEPGCIEYVPTVDTDSDLAIQGDVRKDIVTVVEKWKTVDALKTHLQTPHMAAYREQVKTMVRSVQLHVLQPAY